MNKRIRVSTLAMTSALMLAGSVPALAIVTPALRLSDAAGNVITIDGNGVATASGNCTAATCVTTTSTGTSGPTGTPGTVTWLGTIGNFTAQQPIVGQSKPALVSPTLDIGFSNLISMSGGTLTIQWTDIGFSGTTPTSVSASPSFLVGSGSLSYTLFIDNASPNVPFGTSSAPCSSATTGACTSATSTSVTSSGNNTTVAAGSGVGANASTFSMTAQEVVTLNQTTEVSEDFTANATASSSQTPSSPMISINKSVVGPTTVNAFAKVTYSYLVKNTGNTTLTNIQVADDNGTPTYTGDDFTVCSIASLTAGASQTCYATVIPPVTQGANDSSPGQQFNYSNYHPGGQIICKALSSGDIQFTYLEDQETADNTYGNGSAFDWGPYGGYGYGYGSYNNPLSSLLNNKNAEFQVFDSRGNKCLDFNADYLNYSSSTISHYDGGSVSVYSGNSQNIYGYHSSIADNLNRSRSFANNCLGNSPAGNSDWTNQCAYTVTIKSGAWGSNGFGSVKCIGSSNSNSKGYGHNQHQCQPVNSTSTNTAVVTANFCTGSGKTQNCQTVTSSDTATVTIIANPPTSSKCVPVPTTCNVYGQAPSQCKPQNGGHDGNGYAYCDALIPNNFTCKDGTPFQLGSAYGPSATSGGTIPLPNGKYSYLKFVGAGVNGNQTNQCFTINYTDGTKTNVYQNLSDWCYPSGFSGESIAVSMPYRITPQGGSQYVTTNLYEYSLQCNSSKTVQSVTLPNNTNVVVHGITMVP
jgi:hypothetical protein